MSEPFVPRAVKLRHQTEDRAFVIEGAAASIDPPVEGASLGVLVWNMTLLYLPDGWGIHTLPEGAVRYATPRGEGPVVKGQEDESGKNVLVLVPATPGGQEAITRGTRYLYMRDLYLLVNDDAKITVERQDATRGTLVVESSQGSEPAVAYEIVGNELALTPADMSAAPRAPLSGDSDEAITQAFVAWVRAAGEG